MKSHNNFSSHVISRQIQFHENKRIMLIYFLPHRLPESSNQQHTTLTDPFRFEPFSGDTSMVTSKSSKGKYFIKY